MIYELAVVARSGLGEGDISSLINLVHETIKKSEGEILIEDDWGTKRFAQPTSKGVEKGQYFYFIYSATTDVCNLELIRRFKIAETVLKYIFIKLGPESKRGEIVKLYKTPYSKKYAGSVTDSDDESDSDIDKDRRKFARKRTCWFTVKKIKADWKDPATYSWLLNDFGKISPSRVTGISTKHQKTATTSIKRARQIGLVSHITDRFAE